MSRRCWPQSNWPCPTAWLPKTHVLNILHRLIDGKPTDGPTISAPQTLLLRHEPKANVERYDDLRARSTGGRHAS